MAHSIKGGLCSASGACGAVAGPTGAGFLVVGQTGRTEGSKAPFKGERQNALASQLFLQGEPLTIPPHKPSLVGTETIRCSFLDCPGVSVAPGLIYSPPLDGMEARLLALDVGSASSPAKPSVRAGVSGG